MIRAVLIFLAQLAMASPVLAGPVFDQAPLSDAELADLRGGIRLPNGIDAALTIETQTAVDGAIILMTVVKIDVGLPQVAVFAPGEGASVPAQPQDAAAGSASQGLPTFSFDNRNGLHVFPGAGRLSATVTSAPAPADGGGVPDGLLPVDMDAPAQTGHGLISASGRGGLTSVELTMPDLQVLHLTGNAFGSVIANSGSNRAIDTQTTVSLDLRNAGADVIGSTMLRVADMASGAMAMRH